MEELKPCPFCGGIAELGEVYYRARNKSCVIVKCLGCGVSTKLFPYTDKGQTSAEIAWNRRV